MKNNNDNDSVLFVLLSEQIQMYFEVKLLKIEYLVFNQNLTI